MKNSTIEPNLGMIFLQIDSMSHATFNRDMPHVERYMQATGGWFPFKGHHKVDINTYPNTNLIFTGRVPDNTTEENRVWVDFNSNQYITAYAEDMSEEILEIYDGRTDFSSKAMRLFLFGLPSMNHKLYNSCNWYFPVFERLYEQMLDYATTFQGERHLGWFVSTASTHDDVSGGSMLEMPMLRYMKELDRRGVRNESVIFLYADHGLRFGDQREFFEGAREDSMPMLWISVPQWFEKKHPDIWDALKLNRNRLTSHLDLYHTWKHLMVLNGGKPSPPVNIHCETCQSIFMEVPHNRSCSEAGIPFQFCFCNAHKSLGRLDDLKKKEEAMRAAVEDMNNQLLKFSPGYCGPVRNPFLRSAWEVGNTVIVIFNTSVPLRIFEGTVEKVNGSFSVFQVRNILPNDRFVSCGYRETAEFCDCLKGGAYCIISMLINYFVWISVLLLS